MNLAVQILTFLLQTFLASRMIRWLGLSMTLCVLPVVYMVGFCGLGLATQLSVLVAAHMTHRAAAFKIMVLAQEVRFTVVSREEKYKSKGFIDTAVVRGGEVLAAQLYNGLRELGATLSAVAWLMVPVTVI